ncbi:MAG: RpiB/LacA/LacB family sugar-phosphate isomerase [Candidatus Pacebacteria bacterium]|jgi:ribose 5-phosphate isomerase B|nr:RpiB/LacA/LacB family sugar-phosphate isomerase [Candidatus Paceibacterota bacterium]
MKIYFASDHAGYELKERLKPFVINLGYEVEDLGPDRYIETDDYPDTCLPAARAVVANPGTCAIIIGGSGQGEGIVANRIHGVRAAVYYGGTLDIIRITREHNDANVLALGARFLMEDEAQYAVNLFLTTKYTGDERHVRRIKKIELLSSDN